MLYTYGMNINYNCFPLLIVMCHIESKPPSNVEKTVKFRTYCIKAFECTSEEIKMQSENNTRLSGF